MIKNLYLKIFLVLLFISCEGLSQENEFDWGIQFDFSISYLHSGIPDYDNYNPIVAFLFRNGKDYYFYDQVVEDTLEIEINGNSTIIPFRKDSVYKIFAEINYGWPSTFALTIVKENSLIFQGVTDSSINKNISLIDTSLLSVELVREFIDKAEIKFDCYEKIIPVEYKFSNENESLCLTQNETKIIKGIKIFLGIARRIEYKDNCQDAGMNNLSFIAINLNPI